MSPDKLSHAPPILVDAIPVYRPIGEYEVPPPSSVDVSVLIMTLNEEKNIGTVLQAVKSELSALSLSYELVVMDGGSTDATVSMATAAGARVVHQSCGGYATGLQEAFGLVNGTWVITLDGDCSHEASLIPELLSKRDHADIVVGSRWVTGGSFEGPTSRHWLSWLLNVVFQRILDLPIRDLSSGYRLYRRAVFSGRRYQAKNFSILQEVLIRAYADGFTLMEIPLRYRRRAHGSSHAKLFSFAISYISTLTRMWMIRNDAGSADYDSRAFDSPVFPQRWWQRKRFKNIMYLLGSYAQNGEVLDIGCGSSRIIQSLPHATAFDFSLAKLRFLKNSNPHRVCGSALSLPFQAGSFDCVVHSQLIEHLPMDPALFTEIRRVLKPGGIAIVGTVDYASFWWPIIERVYGWLLPHAYADEHTTHYTLATLKQHLSSAGLDVIEVVTILGSEITLKAVAK